MTNENFRQNTRNTLKKFLQTILIVMLIPVFNFPSQAKLVDGVTRYRIYSVQASKESGESRIAMHNQALNDTNLDLWLDPADYWEVVKSGDGYSIRATTGSKPYIGNGGVTSNLKSYATTFKLVPSGDYYYIKYGNSNLYTYHKTSTNQANDMWLMTFSSVTDDSALWNFVPEHTHNSSGVEYSQNNGSVHNKYTYCNGHGADHSQNRSSTTEAHSYGSWSGWSNYSTSQQRRSRTCSQCGYVEYGYQARPYTITYNVNGGSSLNKYSATINYGATLGTLPTGTRTGYTFKGIYTSPSGGSAISSSTTVTGNATYYAQWTPRSDTKYVVKHQLQNADGNGYKLQDTDNLQGTTDTNVTPATKNYTGFAAPAKQTVNINADGSRVVTYSYTRNKYSATFDGNGGAPSNPSIILYYENPLGTLPTATRVGYDFDGWFTMANGGTQISVDTKLMSDTTYYAHWTPRDDTKYKVEHYLMDVDGNGYTLKDTDNLEGTSDTSETPDVNTYVGFTSPETQTVNVNADGSRVVRYEYTRNKYVFTLGSDVGVSTEGSTETGSYYYGTEITLKAATLDGYQWDRWTNKDTEMETSVIMPAEDLSIAPDVHPITYTITYILNGGKVDYKKKTYNVETPTFYIENPRKKGYNFTGWTGTGIETADTDLSVPVGSFGDKTFEATWGEDIYTVSFDGNGETSGSMETLTVRPGKSIELPENGFVRDGYSFVGWYTTKQDRFGTFYKNGSTVSDLTESVTLHAQWKKDKTPAVPEDNGNNGTGSNGTGNDNGSGNGNGGSGSAGDNGDNGNGSSSGSGNGAGDNGDNTSSGEGGNGSGNGGNSSTGDSGNGDKPSTGDNTGDNGGSGSTGNNGSGRGNDNGHDVPVVTSKEEIGYFGTGMRRNEISISTTLGMNDKKLTLNYNY